MASEELKVKIIGDASNLSGALDKAGNRVSGFADKLGGIGRVATIAGTAVSAAFTKTFIDFTAYETKLVDMAKVTDEPFDQIEKKLSTVDVALGSSKELMEGYYQVISAGVSDPVKALDLLTVAFESGKAAHVEQATVVEGLTKMMAGFEGVIENASEAADLMFAIEKSGQTTVAALVPVIGGLSKMSSDLAILPEEMAAAVAVTTKTAGSTAEAATQYQAILSGLMKPTEAMTESFKTIGENIRGVGEGYIDAGEMIKDLGFVEAMKAIQEHSDATGVSIADLFGRKEAMIGFSAIGAEGFTTLDETILAVNEGIGGAADAFENWSETGAASIDGIKNTFSNFSTEVGEQLAPMIKELLDAISGIITKITEWADENPKLFETIVKVAAVIGAMAAVGGPILMAVAAFQFLGPAIALVGTITTGPIGLLILAVGAVIAVWKNWDTIVEFVKKVFEDIKVFIANFVSDSTDRLTNVIDWIMTKFEDLGELPGKMLQWGKDIITDFVNGIVNLIDSLLGGAINLIIDEFKDIIDLPGKAIEWGKDLVTGFSDGMKDAGSKIKDAANNVAGTIKGWFKPGSPTQYGPLSEGGGMNQWGYNIVEDYSEGLKKAIPKIEGAGDEIATAFSDKMLKLNTDTTLIAEDMMDNIEGAIEDATPDIDNKTQTLADNILEVFSDLFDDFKTDFVIPFINQFADELTPAVENFFFGIEGYESDWETFWGNLWSTFKTYIANIIAKLLIALPLLFLFNAFTGGIPATLWDVWNVLGFKGGGEVKGFADGGTTDTIPAMLTPGEYVIAKPMTDFIRNFKAIPGNLIDAISGGMPTPTPAFASGGLVGAGYGASPSSIYVDIHDNRISDDVDIRKLASTVSDEILRKINMNKRH